MRRMLGRTGLFHYLVSQSIREHKLKIILSPETEFFSVWEGVP